ncbi:multidrug efflux RND transporter permease subunit [Aurantiacibacter rhizosphaerae]|uniref:Multidrug efflux RND transporter permease subunit n=1 Tax=Aurantiacibacter rhizosphaerae TaxID=2691582 RepID=A0A844X9N8_9SPHN|nr:multidrug efflux RND transporter permease subunit [Aurantiacibacter rhizosphaerae]MWV27141.1 multidrug efflux RND transporter permease subunit [Aurantiacibacter rhizosphaerae]
MARFFIDRPIFAWVISLGILLAGFIALRALPIEQYPDVAPPSLSINVVYPGADAQTLEQNVTQVIEQQLNGVDGFLYMDSSSLSNGTASITLTFEAGTDIDIAQTEVQNRLSTVEARLPEEVRRQGITVRQANPGFLLIIALTSDNGALDFTDLGNIAATSVIDEIRRVPGVGDVTSFGSEYAMRIWLDPDRLAAYKLPPSAVLAAVREQNAQTAGGSIGALPVQKGQEITATIITENRFETEEEFRRIILRADPSGAAVTLGDVARIELGARSYATTTSLNKRPMAGLAVQLATGANALSTAENVKQRMEEIGAGLPTGVEWSIPYDTSPFVQISVDEVVKTLIEAMALVFLVMFLFLQTWRATLIPTLVVPIALAGACLGLWLLGFSINVLSLFAMVLAIGILVDDAIVVIENVERIMREEGLGPLEATRKAMDQITGAIVGITLVLIAVFVPMAFFPGATGGIYRQFSVTLAISIFFSALLALTLTPALCATFLRAEDIEKEGEDECEDSGDAINTPDERPLPVGWRGKVERVRRVMGRFFARFNRWFARMTQRYGRTNDKILSRPMRALAGFLLLVAVTVLLFMRLPGGFLPTEDQGYLITVVQSPGGSTQERLDEAVTPVEDYWLAQDDVEDLIVIRGFSFFGQGQNNAMMFATLKDWSERSASESSAAAIAERSMGTFMGLDSALAFTIEPPAIQSLGEASGFTMKLQDRGGVGRESLVAARDQLLGLASQSPALANIRPEDQPVAPQLHVEIDRVKAKAMGLSIVDVNTALSISFGSAYANDFNREGRVLQVLVQAEAPFRMKPEDVLSLRIPNAQGALVPFSSFATAEWTAGPPSLARYNGYPAMTVSGTAAPGKSSGAALKEMEQLASQLPEGIGFEWTGLSYEERQAGGQIGLLLALSVLIVFLVLAALYESWSVPLSVLLIIPAGVLGSVLFSMARGLSADIYFNVGLITIIGLAAKNAILIVEFAIEQEEEGKPPLAAVREAARLRLRPIIMTSLAFILGMVPLVLSSGAGAASRIAVGTGVMGGMIAATAIGIFMIPVLYLLVRTRLAKGKRSDTTSQTAQGDTA